MPVKVETPYIVIVFVTTAGQNGENLGLDQAQTILFTYLVYDVLNNQIANVVSRPISSLYVRPTIMPDCPTPASLGEKLIQEEALIQTELNENEITRAGTLQHVLQEFDNMLVTSNLITAHTGQRAFTLMTDGQLHLRNVLQPEVSKKNMKLAPYFYSFYDLRKEFKDVFNPKSINCIKDMLEHLQIQPTCSSIMYGERHVRDMAKIVEALINSGHKFDEPEVIKDRLEPGIWSKDEEADDGTCVKIRGLPWQASDHDIAKFFLGLNIAKGGVALCLSPQGRRNGEAFVRFECQEHRDLSIRRMRHYMKARYIEVYKDTVSSFISVAGGSNEEAQKFLKRFGANGGQVIMRMRGLPYSCTTQQVLDFFAKSDEPVNILDGDQGVLFVHQADGRATGDAFVVFGSEAEFEIALRKHKQAIGPRYIELFRSTTAEVQQVLNRSMDPRANFHENRSNNNNDEKYIDIGLLTPYQLNNYTGTVTPTLLPASPTFSLVPQQMITQGSTKDCIRLRGLPFEATVQHILAFLGEHASNIMFQGVHMVYDGQGVPSGEAFIQMSKESAAREAAEHRHRKYMTVNDKKRFIEVFQCSGDDMNLVLTNGIIPSTIPGGNEVPQQVMELQQQQPQTPYSMAGAVAGGVGMVAPVQGMSPAQSSTMMVQRSMFQTETRLLNGGNGVLGAGTGVLGAGNGVLGAGNGVLGAAPVATLPTVMPGSQSAQMPTIGAFYNPYAPLATSGMLPAMATSSQPGILPSGSQTSAVFASGVPASALAMPPPALVPSGPIMAPPPAAMARPPMIAASPQGAIQFQTATNGNGATQLAMSPNGYQNIVYWYPQNPAASPQGGSMAAAAAATANPYYYPQSGAA